jgi:D-alanyl-D-alanine carboxypeptidase
MKTTRTALLTMILALVMFCCEKYDQSAPTDLCQAPNTPINAKFPGADSLRAILQRYTKQGIPGATLAVYSPVHGYFATTAGYAKIENKTKMELCHLQYLQSISKVYMGVAILRLQEQGKIDLDAPITKYLSEKWAGKISRAAEITVKMLLQHTSGVPEYGFEPAYIAQLLQRPNLALSSYDYLNFIAGKPLLFEPGSKHKYSNTNFLLLALIADAITGDHAQLIQKEIFQPLGLVSTKYRNAPNYLDDPKLVNVYWDRHANEHLENVSQMQKTNVGSLVGDDGIVTTPLEALAFMRGLMEGKLLSKTSLDTMLSFVKNEKGDDVYGLGIYRGTYGGKKAYGHGGSGIGAGGILYYLPENQVYVFLSANFGTILEGPITQRTGQVVDKVMGELIKVN